MDSGSPGLAFEDHLFLTPSDVLRPQQRSQIWSPNDPGERVRSLTRYLSGWQFLHLSGFWSILKAIGLFTRGPGFSPKSFSVNGEGKCSQVVLYTMYMLHQQGHNNQKLHLLFLHVLITNGGRTSQTGRKSPTQWLSSLSTSTAFKVTCGSGSCCWCKPYPLLLLSSSWCLVQRKRTGFRGFPQADDKQISRTILHI